MIVPTLLCWNSFANMVIRLLFDIDKVDLAYLNADDYGSGGESDLP